MLGCADEAGRLSIRHRLEGPLGDDVIRGRSYREDHRARARGPREASDDTDLHQCNVSTPAIHSTLIMRLANYEIDNNDNIDNDIDNVDNVDFPVGSSERLLAILGGAQPCSLFRYLIRGTFVYIMHFPFST